MMNDGQRQPILWYAVYNKCTIKKEHNCTQNKQLPNPKNSIWAIVLSKIMASCIWLASTWI